MVIKGKRRSLLLGGSVLGDGLGALRNGVLGQFTRQQKTDRGLDFPRRDGRSLVVMRKTRRFGGNTLENVVHKRVHDRHSLARDSSIGVNLLQHLVDVDAERFLPRPAFLLFVRGTDILLGLTGLLDSFSTWGWRHVDPETKIFGLVFERERERESVDENGNGNTQPKSEDPRAIVLQSSGKENKDGRGE